MHYFTFVIIDPTGDPEMLVTEKLAPFNEQLKVAPYREYLDKSDIARMAEHYQLKRNDLQALAQRLEDWHGWPGGVDGKRLFYTTTLNPDGRWDWYEIGGRWNGRIKGAKRNVISTRALRKSPHLKDALPFYVVTPEGTWLEHQSFFQQGLGTKRSQQKRDAGWLREVTEVLEDYPKHRVVAVDIHC